MDFNALRAQVEAEDEPVAVPIYNKEGDAYLSSDGSECTISVVGSESKRYKTAQDKQMRQALRIQRSKLEPADLRNRRTDLAASAVTSWHGWEANGEPFPCTPENVKALLEIEHILIQVEAGIERHASFFGKPSPI